MDISAFTANVPLAVAATPLSILHLVPVHSSPLVSHHQSHKDARTFVTASLVPARRTVSRSSTWRQESEILLKQPLMKMSLHALWSKATAAFSFEEGINSWI
ncbi:hypothetical protein NPIL_699411 [Nephila pilipes]|uniref:Uncharacterized protein n=1 Tax=Nephila pilipes TaxID=299642 RepID=A0A8X6PVW7_NEPPI|nr:hypothetical protein NPIL_699411 [Nephila pilipes]